MCAEKSKAQHMRHLYRKSCISFVYQGILVYSDSLHPLAFGNHPITEMKRLHSLRRSGLSEKRFHNTVEQTAVVLAYIPLDGA